MNSTASAEVWPTHTPVLFEAAVRRAAELLRAGQVVALPTETVYGLAANAWDPQAVARLYEIKGRPAHNPIIVHVAGLELARRCAGAWPASADKLAAAFWPGPLTLVLPRAGTIPPIVTAGGETVAVRWPNHPFIQAVIRDCGFPLAAPSANRAAEVSPTNAGHVQSSLGGRIALIIDGGQCQVGIESTVVDLTVAPARVLRPGMIHRESLEAVLGQSQLTLTTPAAGGGEPLRSPGLLERHYAPRARLMMLSWVNDQDLRAQLVSRGCLPGRCAVLAHARIPSTEDLAVSVIPHDAEAYARALYAELHRCDGLGMDCIVVESLPEGPQWSAIADRLRRACSPGPGFIREPE